MRVFVTGGSGWIGSALLPELLDAGHEVLGLARSEAAAEALSARGATAVRGSIDDLEVLAAGADACDGVVHLAFRHDVAFAGDFTSATDSDLAAIEIFGRTLRGSDRPLLIASGVSGLPEGDGSEPFVLPESDSALQARLRNAETTVRLAGQGVRSCVVGLPPTVHGDGDNGFVPTLIGIARTRGVSSYVGDGTNRWPAVHRSDAARLFRLALEQAPAGSVLHAVQDEGIPVRRLAEIIGASLDVPVESVSPEQAAQDFGFIGHVLGADLAASSELTRKLLDWEPTGPDLLEDLEAGHYFRTPA